MATVVHRLLLAATLVVLAAACDVAEDRHAELEPAAAPPPAHVDSALPLDEWLRRFRADLRDTPSVLSGGERSRDALARAFVAAVATHDTAALDRMILDRGEFAWLYYPEHPLTRKPYELDAPMMWMQMRSGSESGIRKVLRTYGGHPLRFEALDCPRAPERHGGNATWSWCTVRVRDGESPARTLTLFGSIVERDGAYKFVSYENKL